MKQSIIGKGAEATIFKLKDKIVKDRIPKKYRYPELDNKIRRQRTKREAKLLTKASKIISAPEPLSKPGAGRMIHMPYITGKKLSEHLDSLKNATQICEHIGKNIALLHDSGIIHGDLTTSNMILKNNDVYFIDFGLGFNSDKTEDKAVDLHLIKQALEAKHFLHFEKFFKAILKGYKTSKHYSKTLERLKKVEARGRYKKGSCE
jgi:Kae1-associated kinase Bud32